MSLSANIRKILLPRFDTLGDIVLLEPFLRALHEAFQESEITLLVSEAYHQLAPLFPKYVNWQVWRINPYRNPYLEQKDEKLVKDILSQLESERWDLVLFTKYEWTWVDHVIAARLTGVQQLAIGKKKEAPEWLKSHLPRLGIERHFSQVAQVPVEERTHESEKYEALLNHLTGENRVLPDPKLSVPTQIKKDSRAVLGSLELDKKNFCVCLPAGIENISIKVWPTEKFAEVITWLKHRHRINTLLVGHENERNIVEKVASLAGEKRYIPSIWLGKDGEIPLLAGLLERARFYLGNDTGPMHIGAALGIPVIALFGGGHWPRFIPNGSGCHVIVRPMPCFYCNWKCPFGDAPCVKDLPLALVQEAIKMALKKTKSDGDRVSIREAERYPEITNELIQKARKIFKELETDWAARLEVIEDLSGRLQESEADRAARLEVIEDLGRRLEQSEVDRAARLEVIENLGKRLQESEADRAARLEVIEDLGRRLEQSEADRAARLEVIEDLGRRLEESEVDRVARLEVIENLGKRLQESEADRAARLEVIEDLGRRLEQSEADRAARLEVIEDLGRRLEESEADRAARLEVIEDLGKRLEQSEADRAARLEAIRRYEREISDMIQRLSLLNSVLPKISIVTPSFNHGAYIEKTIRSVIDQGYPNLEYIVIDGGSTDGTLDVIRRFESHLSHWISETDSGQAEAINKGFSKATGDLISWLNSDDTYTEGALWEWAKAVLRYPKADIWMASHHNYIDEWDNVLSVVENIFVSHAEFVKYWKTGGIRVNQPSVFFRRQLLKEVGEIDPHLRYALDYDFFLRLSREHRIITVNGKWVNYRLHRGAKSGTPAGEGFHKFIPEWHLASKKQWGRPWNLRWWGFFTSFQFYRPFFSLGQLTSDFISGKQMMLKWFFLGPRFLWYLITGQGSLSRW